MNCTDWTKSRSDPGPKEQAKIEGRDRPQRWCSLKHRLGQEQFSKTKSATLQIGPTGEDTAGTH